MIRAGAPSPTDPDAVVVDNTEGESDFSNIQAAVDDPDTEPGDTILIRAGAYATEEEIEVTDSRRRAVRRFAPAVKA